MTFPSCAISPRPDAICPACGHVGLTSFYTLAGVPLQSNLLLRTLDEALAVPTGDLDLAHCAACGFIANLAFDPASQELSAQYEASQGFSATFNSFARSLARTWAERYQLRGKTAIEIGCGKGEFLATLCREAGCRGVGFDPTLDPNRLPDTAGLDVEFVADHFDERSADRPMDFVCCRHTLEHIPNVSAFLRMLRNAIGDKPHVRIGFEVPDTLRVLDEGAFWDIYYEHCSYFTADSLASAFEAAGFEVLDLRGEFDGQYLVLEAEPSDDRRHANGERRVPQVAGTPETCGGSRATPHRSRSTATCGTSGSSVANHSPVHAAVGHFAHRCGGVLRRWKDLIDKERAGGGRVALWGASSKAVGFLTSLGLTRAEVPEVVDINPHKQGTCLPTSGSLIVGPDALRRSKPTVVVVMNPIYREEISAELAKRGVESGVVTL